MIALQIRFERVLVLGLLIFGILFAEGQIAVVNSQDYQDVIGGAVWAAENNASYFFVLTPQHGAYLSDFLSKTDGQILYFESSKPVDPSFSQALAPERTTSYRSSELWRYFASNSPNPVAVLVASGNGMEAVSIAPYAALSGAGLYFADAASAQGEFSKLLNEGKSIIAYGSIASSLPKSSLSSADVINTGSPYSDNIAILSRWQHIKPAPVVLFASGRTFEKSMVLSGFPVALVGRTEVPPALESWLSSAKVQSGVAVQGDADIGAALAALRSGLNLSIFALLGEGYSGDAQMKPAAVMPLPGPFAIARLDSISYDASAKEFVVKFSNVGNSMLFVRAAVSLPSGFSSSSLQQEISPASSATIRIPLDASQYVSGSKIGAVLVQVYSGTTPSFSEAVDSLNISNVPVTGLPAQESTTSSPIWGIIVALIAISLIIAAAIILRMPKPSTKQPAQKKKKVRARRKK